MNPQNRTYLVILFMGAFFGSLLTTLDSGTFRSPIIIFSWLICFAIVSPDYNETEKWRKEKYGKK